MVSGEPDRVRFSASTELILKSNKMKKDLIIFVLCCIAASTIESTGVFFLVPLASILGAFALTIGKLLNEQKPNNFEIDQLLDYSTRNDMMEG